MTSTQVSFASFALAQQAATCPPPVAAHAAAPVVAHGLSAGDVGECTPRPRFSALRRARYARRRFHPRHLRKTYVTYWPGSWEGPTAFFWYSRAHAFNCAQRYGMVFVDLGAAA